MSLVPRSPTQSGRTSTPLELFFDLCFVVAIAQAAAQLHHAEVEHHVSTGIVSFLMVFFAIWWAWMNLTWFASAYDSDDTWYRLAIFVQIAGVLVVAAAIPAVFEDQVFTGVVLGYVIMRLAMVSLWLRAAAGDGRRRRTCLSYAGGITVLQVGWVLWLLVPSGLQMLGFLLLMALELMLPLWAERSGATPWHPHHIAERYGLLTIIVLGESILAIFLAFQATSDSGDGTSDLVVTGVAGVIIVCSMWWLYFSKPAAATVTTARMAFEGGSARRAFLWGYGHYVIFASAAAVGAGMAAAVDLAGGDDQAGGLAVAIPLALFVAVVSLLPGLAAVRVQVITGLASATVLIMAAVLGVPLIGLSLVIPIQLILLTAVDRASSAGAGPGPDHRRSEPTPAGADVTRSART